MSFVKEVEGVYRLKVPFEDLYTSVFLILTEQGNVLVDSATYVSDVDNYITPALKEMGLSITDIHYLVLTHKHGDHVGGKNRILELAPSIKIVQEIPLIALKGLTVYEMKGHTLDCIGVLDIQSGTLISGDGLQGAGVGKYRCSLKSNEEYIKTIERIRQDKRIENILFSHAYEPWDKDGVFGREEVERCLLDCIKYIKGEI
ncbi:MAG: MBL fold metallo-hydrolase [Clostridia bacterium]|nr:MBL fold metallo-hydrolase [Clostridia bacterium]